MTTMPSNRLPSPFSVFQRFKRCKLLEAREKDGKSGVNVERIIMAVPGLEDYSSAAVDSLSPEDLQELRRIKIRSALQRYAPSLDDTDSGDKDPEFIEINKLMLAAWRAIDDFTDSVFEELAGGGTYGGMSLATVSPVISPELKLESSSSLKSIPPSPTSDAKDSAAEDGELCLIQEVTFPRQLMDIIEHQTTSKGGAVTEKGKRVLEWLPAGDGFVIRDKVLLEKDVLPKHFSAKCKFMSFVRKLYRWGFRQLVKDSRGVLIFSHSDFRRGDKKRCLRMRSVVKKSPAQARKQTMKAKAQGKAVPPPTPKNDAGTYAVSPAGTGATITTGVMPPPPLTMDQFHSGLRPSQPFLDHCGDMSPLEASAFGGSSPPLGLASHYPSSSRRGMTSAELFQAALRMERMEKREEMLNNMQMMDILHYGGTYAPPPSLSSFPSLGPGDCYGGNPNLGKMSDVELAYEMMKQDSRMEALQALEFAKRGY